LMSVTLMSCFRRTERNPCSTHGDRTWLRYTPEVMVPAHRRYWTQC
jgi:hypothetical protein